MVTRDAIVSVAPAAAPYCGELFRQMGDIGLTVDPQLAAMFLGQVMVESAGFERVTESLNYSETSLLKQFKRSRISVEQCGRYGRNRHHPADQVMLANILYGGEFGRRKLGNTAVGDGWTFRGRGLKQLTGRDNYTRFSRAWLGTDELVRRPDRVADPDGAVASAVWFWSSNELTEVARLGSVALLTARVNGGENGLAERERWTREFRAAFDA